MQEGKIIQSVAKAMSLLNEMAAAATPLTLAELSAKTGYPKSTVHGILSTMREYSVVSQDEDGRYGLGIRLFEYGCILSNTWPIIELAKPFIQHVSYQTGETVFLSVLDRGEVITLTHAESRNGTLAAAEVGSRLPVYCTSQGKLFLALMEEEERSAILRRTTFTAFTNRTITSESDLREELTAIRAQGYALENGEYKTGLRSASAPIYDETGKVRYAIGIIGMFRQLETERFEQAVQLIQETAVKLTESLQA